MDSASALIGRSALHEAVAARLREMIVEGTLAPGARLNERELCDQLGISRTPLREALRALAADELVKLTPNRGAQVVQLSAADIAATFQVLGALEGLAGELACRNMTPYRLSVIAAMQAEMEAAHARADLPAYYRLNRAIHERIADAAANPVLTRTHAALNDRLHAWRFRSNFNLAKWNRAVAEHADMLAALRDRDGPRMRWLLEEHLAHKCEAVLEELRAAAPGSPS